MRQGLTVRGCNTCSTPGGFCPESLWYGSAFFRSVRRSLHVLDPSLFSVPVDWLAHLQCGVKRVIAIAFSFY